ncbi:MAG: thermonuclease family protein [Candidatus Caldatribacterium sp.]|nr:thermonuclease family protein [Candidatus Caldatribacterium sp.]
MRFLLVLLILLALLLFCNGAFPSPDVEPSKEMNLIKARAIEVINGDAIHVELEDGRQERLWLIGVDIPKDTAKTKQYEKEAITYIESKLLERDVWLELDVQKRDRDGRLLAYVWLTPPTEVSDKEVRAKMLNAIPLLEGYAQLAIVPPNVKYEEYFRKYQQEVEERNSASLQKSIAYIGNRNTKKFHRLNCRWVEKIAPGNKVPFSSREEAVQAGYEPCKVCNP